jgi:hypothetical protein
LLKLISGVSYSSSSRAALVETPFALAVFQMASSIKDTYSLPLSIGIDSGSNLAENLEERVKRGLPFEPVLVVISSTPLAPAVP